MGIPLRTLIIEDSEDDSLLVIRSLKKGGFDPAYERLETAEAMGEALGRETWDIIISDYNMPHFNGLAALKLCQEKGLDIPFILVSGTIGEETAVAAMVAGAHDYLMKDNLSRLVPAVQRELKEAETRRSRKRAQEALRESENRYHELFEAESDAIVLIDNATGDILETNSAAAALYGYDHADFLTKKNTDLSAEPAETQQFIRDTPINPDQIVTIPLRFHRKKDGTVFPTEITGRFFIRNGRPVHLLAIRDITERKKAEAVIQAALQEKEVLLREIHHRVMNNMQVISSLFNLQAGKTRNAECREILKEGQTRLRAMSLVHEKLYKSHDLSKIDLAVYIKNLVAHLFSVYLTDPDRVRSETDFENCLLDINSAVPCGLILNELISNSLKHAFPEGRKGMIRIGLKRGPDETIILRVADDGIGFPESFDFHRSESLGFQIANLLVGQLEGTIELDRTSGTTFIVTFRELKYAPRN